MMPVDKYVSMFRINGDPILPPMMTIEKRFEMQMYREKAIQLERKFVIARSDRKVQFSETKNLSPLTTSKSFDGEGDIEDKSCLSENSSSIESTPSRRDQDNSGSKMEQNKILVSSATNTFDKHHQETNERMLKLSKSKTICFDNTTSAIIRALTEDEFNHLAGKSPECQKIYVCELINGTNLKSSAETKKALNVPLPQKSNVTQTIPSIHVNPPTPLAGPSNISEVLSATESIYSNGASGFQSSQATRNQALESTEDSAEDLTENAAFSTPQNRITGVVARELHFELIQDELSLHSRSDGDDNSQERSFRVRSPQRSATSPSLKSLCDTIGTCSLVTSPRADTASTHNSLVRSNSFTLDGPSKVLLDHIRQQNRQKISNKSDGSIRSKTPTHRVGSRQRSTPSPSAWRDTVESKAKRVQKKAETKSSSRASSNVRSKAKATFNNYANNSTTLWNSTLPPIKLKRSPYDAKGSAMSSNKQHGKATMSSHKQQSTSKPQKPHVKKSTSSTTYTVRETPSRASLPNNTSCIERPNQTTESADVMAEIDHRHRQKLLNLIAQQQEEQRRLQQVFESQQRMLLEQLNNERYRQYYTEADNLTAELHIEGISLMSPIQQNSRNANDIYNETTTAPFDHSLSSVSSSYMSPCLTGMLSGFTTTTTTTCEMPLSVPMTPNNGHATIERSVEVIEMTSPVYTNNNDLNGTTGDINSPTSANRQSPGPSKVKSDINFEKLNDSATIINAYARGFLVRRLFQTEQIQRIVQTIRDTLIFVLNLHMETMENAEANTASNIKLKARLLQQLASASRTLHLIFFQTNIKERMEIIARDRKRIKTKLLSRSLKRSPRIA